MCRGAVPSLCSCDNTMNITLTVTSDEKSTNFLDAAFEDDTTFSQHFMKGEKTADYRCAGIFATTRDGIDLISAIQVEAEEVNSEFELHDMNCLDLQTSLRLNNTVPDLEQVWNLMYFEHSSSCNLSESTHSEPKDRLTSQCPFPPPQKFPKCRILRSSTNKWAKGQPSSDI